jgi:adenylyltransferase/sulfurtransferase
MPSNSPSPFEIDELKRYSRQIFLPEIGYQGQVALKNASALIIGLGGLGSPCSLYLNASGIGELVLVDYDEIELSNLQRQVIHSTKNIGNKKTASAVSLLTQFNPHTHITPIEQKLTQKNAKTLIKQATIVVDCSDNFDTRYLVNTLCKHYKKPLISASVIAFQGQLACFDFRKEESACYACLFPPPDSNSPPQEIQNCSEVGVLSTAAGILGVMQANETLKMLMGLPTLDNRLLLLDTLSQQQRIIQIKADPACQCQKQHP